MWRWWREQCPKLLVLHLLNARKGLAIPTTLDVTPYCVTGGDNKPTYELVASVAYIPMVPVGHFVAYRRVRDQWLCVSDSDVKAVSVREVSNAASFLVFYDSMGQR